MAPRRSGARREPSIGSCSAPSVASRVRRGHRLRRETSPFSASSDAGASLGPRSGPSVQPVIPPSQAVSRDRHVLRKGACAPLSAGVRTAYVIGGVRWAFALLRPPVLRGCSLPGIPGHWARRSSRPGFRRPASSWPRRAARPGGATRLEACVRGATGVASGLRAAGTVVAHGVASPSRGLPRADHEGPCGHRRERSDRPRALPARATLPC